jgi:GST-like protein
VNIWKRQDQNIDDFPHVKRWLETLKARPAVQRGLALGLELRQGIDMKDPNVQSVLFGQRARSA